MTHCLHENLLVSCQDCGEYVAPIINTKLSALQAIASAARDLTATECDYLGTPALWARRYWKLMDALDRLGM